MTEKKSITITITDLDDLDKVWVALDNLFRTIIIYYIDNDFDKLNRLVLSVSVYFGKMLKLLGYTGEDFEDRNE